MTHATLGKRLEWLKFSGNSCNTVGGGLKDCHGLGLQQQKNWKRVVVERERTAEVFTFTSGSFCLSILTLVTDSSSKLGGEPWAAVEYTAGYSLFATLS